MRFLRITAGVLVTITCLVAAMWGIDWNAILAAFRQADYRSLPLFLLLMVVFFWLKMIRWRLLLSPIRRFTTRDVGPALMIGFMGNNILPAHLGEFMRVYVLSRQYGLSQTAVLSTVILERMFDIVAILLLLGCSLVMVPNLPADLRTTSLYIAVGTAVAIVVVLIYVLFTRWFMSVIEAILRRVPLLSDHWRDRILGMLEAGATGLASIRDIRLLPGIVATSIAQWIINGLTICVALRAFQVPVTLPASLVVLGVTAFGVVVPSTPGFFGVIQFCFRIALEPFGYDSGKVVAASVYYHLLSYIPVTGVGLWYLNRVGLRLGDFSQASESTRVDSA